MSLPQMQAVQVFHPCIQVTLTGAMNMLQSHEVTAVADTLLSLGSQVLNPPRSKRPLSLPHLTL